MPKILRNKSTRNVLIAVGIILGIALTVYLIFAGRHYFTRRGIRQVQVAMNAYGAFSPVAVFLLIFVSVVIPPLPIPTPLVEMAAGYMYGFWPAFFLVWISQILSSIAAYGFSRYIGKRVFKKILKNPIVAFYQAYIDEHGAMAVFVTRATMSSPFSIISFLSGFTNMRLLHYSTATFFGTIIESALFSFIGSIIRGTRLRLWFVFIFVVVMGTLGPLLTYLFMKLIRNGKKNTLHQYTIGGGRRRRR